MTKRQALNFEWKEVEVSGATSLKTDEAFALFLQCRS